MAKSVVLSPRNTPHCLGRQLKVPRMCLIQESNVQAIEIIRNFGYEMGCPEEYISQACRLASGFSDVVVVLERLLSIRLAPGKTFDSFVSSNSTLKCIDELLQAASTGTRTIATTTVVNAFSFQPDYNKPAKDLRCEEVLAQFLQVKKPQVIIHCDNI